MITFQQEVAECLFDCWLQCIRDAPHYRSKPTEEQMRYEAALMVGEFILTRNVMDDPEYMRAMCIWLNNRREAKEKNPGPPRGQSRGPAKGDGVTGKASGQWVR